MMKKLLSVFLALVLALSGVGFSNADGVYNPIKILDVDINGNDMDGVDYLHVERGDSLKINVEIESLEDIKDVKVKAYIAGYEYDEIEDVTPIFDMEEGVRDFKTLRLNIPEDLNVNENYELRIRVYNQEYEAGSSYGLRIKAIRHFLNIVDVIFTPGLTVNSGQPLFVNVRLENLGDKDEEDIKVEVSIPQLGKTGATYIDELVAVEEGDEEEDSDSSDTIYIDTKGAQAGKYDLIVRITYNRGHSTITKNYELTIEGVSAVAEEVLVSAIETSKSIQAGQGIVYEIGIANMGTHARSFTVEVIGLDWGSYRVDPTPAVVQGASTQKMFVYVSPNEEVTGQRAFTVNVKEGNNIVKQINFQANIGEKRKEWSNVLTGLEIGFVVLLIILVILGIILAATRMGKKEESEEPLGETYY